MLNILQILNRKTLAILSSFLFIHSIVAQVSLPKNKVLVYTTSAETNLRISISDTLEFKHQTSSDNSQKFSTEFIEGGGEFMPGIFANDTFSDQSYSSF